MADIPIRTSRGTPAGASLFFIGKNAPQTGLQPQARGETRPTAEIPAERKIEALAAQAKQQQMHSKNSPHNIRKKFNLCLTHSKNRRIMEKEKEKEKDSGKGQGQ